MMTTAQIVLALCVGVSAQVLPPPPPPPPPPQGRSATPEVKGTSLIRGHVRTADGRPLRRVQVRVTGTGLPEARTVSTGLEGEYELTELAAGRFSLSFTRAGYLPVNYGQRGYGEPGAPIELAAGAAAEKIDAVMVRGGVVTGRVSDETGEPIAGVQIWPMQQQFFRGQRQLVPVAIGTGHIQTDDTGQYRVASLPPGEYVIAARIRDTWMSDEKEPQMLSYAPTYFPGTAKPAEARRVKVVAGQEATAIDVALVTLRAAKVSGTAVSSTGALFSGGSVSVTQEITGPSGGTMSIVGSARIDPDGAFVLRDLPPGDYTFRAVNGGGDGPPETAIAPVSVSGADIEGLVLGADPGAVLSGTVVTDTGEPLPATLTASTTLVPMQTTAVRTGKDDGVVGRDGAFTRKSVSGTVVVRVSPLPAGWAVKTIAIGNRDYARLPVDLRPGQQVGDVRIVVTKSFPSVSGRVSDAAGRPRAATVLLFPVDPARWIEGGSNQRIAPSTEPGSFRFDTVVPGEYFIVALETMQAWQMNDPEFLEEQKPHATKLVVGNEDASIDLKVVRR